LPLRRFGRNLNVQCERQCPVRTSSARSLRGGESHEPSYCRGGMWLRPCRLFGVDAKPRFFPLHSTIRGVAGRIRATRRRCQNRAGRSLSHPLRTDRAVWRRAGGEFCPQRLPANDRACSRGIRRAVAAESGLCRAPAADPCPPGQEKSGRSKEAPSGEDRVTMDCSRPSDGPRTGCRFPRRRLSLAASAVAIVDPHTPAGPSSVS
jgi:hypothetical protein